MTLTLCSLRSLWLNSSAFSYDYTPGGNIKQWTQSAGSNPAQAWTLGYDKADQLISGTLALAASPQTILSQQSFKYDKAGNRQSQQIGSGVKKASFNNLNQQTDQSAGGWMRFKGQTNEPAYVKVKSDVDDTYVQATNEVDNGFNAVVPVNTGTNTISVQAKDTSPNANTRTKQYSVSVDAASGKTFTYDLVGNMISDGSKTYTWDAENQLVKILYADATSTEFFYDGRSGRVKTLEKDSAGTIASEKRFIWCGGNQPSEERNSSNVVTIRYFAQGEQVIDPSNSSLLASYFYAKDHLNSVRELVDSSGVVRARYDYDLWGNRTKLSGDLDTMVSFTGHHWHSQSESLETMYRFYRPDLALWLNRDPLGEEGGIRLYGYVLNDPVNYWDPYGLAEIITNMSNGTTTFIDDNGNSTTYPSNNQVTGNSKEGAENPYESSDVYPVDGPYKKNPKAFGPNAILKTDDERGRWIHGGGSKCEDPTAPRQGWCPTHGCTRMQNKDVAKLVQQVKDYKKANANKKVPYKRTGVAPARNSSAQVQ
jgi:RHS repeat-associated protein